MTDLQYAELHTTTNYSFLYGASHPEEYVEQAANLGYKAIAITDRCSLGGIVRAYDAAQRYGISLIVGASIPVNCQLYLSDTNNTKNINNHITNISVTSATPYFLLYPKTPKGYALLSSLITEYHCSSITPSLISLKEFSEEGVIILPLREILGPTNNFLSYKAILNLVTTIKSYCSENSLFSLGLSVSLNSDDTYVFRIAKLLATDTFIPLVATGNVIYHIPERKPLHDILTCIREKCTIYTAGDLLEPNSERYLHQIADIRERFHKIDNALDNSLIIANTLSAFSLDQLKYEYPAPECPKNYSPLKYLKKLVYKGANKKYHQVVPSSVKKLIEDELKIIQELNYEKFFLTCFDIVQFARSRKILHQGRGAAANSAVCFCLGITSVDPTKIDLLFGRFISRERNEPPDIDIDFEHERREEVIQYLFEKYGRRHTALTAEIVTYRHKSAIRDVGRVLGIAPELINIVAKSIHNWTDNKIDEEALTKLGLNFDLPLIRRLVSLSNALLGFPRHRSQHVGGFIVSSSPLSDIVPIVPATMPGRTIIEWDKDDIERLGILKIDILALGMLSCIRRAFFSIAEKTNDKELLTLETVPREVPQVYEMLCQGDSIGVFQVESRAQISMLPRLQPRQFYDLVIQVAIVRPGPIQGNMVHPYLKRRAGLEVFNFPDESVAKILGKTCGVPLFQEQAMRLAVVLANFTPGEAEQLRRAMSSWKRNEGVISQFKDRVINGMIKNGYSADFANNCLNQIKGFSEYGFPEAHAASFANLVYISAWLKYFYPEHFTAALLNSQPMGFYAPAQLIADAKRHNISVLPIDILTSDWETIVESDNQSGRKSIRLGFHLIKGIHTKVVIAIISNRKKFGLPLNIQDLWRQLIEALPSHSKIIRLTLKLLAHANAFLKFNLNSREALWQIQSLPKLPPSLALSLTDTLPASLPLLSRTDSLLEQYKSVGFSLNDHPLMILRERLQSWGAYTAIQLSDFDTVPNYSKNIRTAGLITIRQKPSTAKGVLFLTIEDETGFINLVVLPHKFNNWRHIILTSSLVFAEGTLQRTGKIPYICVESLRSIDKWLN